MVQISNFLVALTAASIALAHPHHKLSDAEITKRDEFHTRTRRSLANCQSSLRRRGGPAERAIARRQAFAKRARAHHGLASAVPYLKKRDVDTVLNTSHASNLTGLTADTDPSVLFDSNSTCVLWPDVTEGPYYVEGEYIRRNVTEGQQGVPTYVDVEFIDVNTCEPVQGVVVDFWHVNATGVYSGVVASGNGDDTVESNLNTTFLRGLQITSDEGAVQFETIFPGHYTGRTRHIHIMSHANGTFFDNGTFFSDYVSHVGQLFFDQSLGDTVEELAPYNTNTQDLTTNSDDTIFAGEADEIDPMLEYVLLGDELSEGILAWTSIGIDRTAPYEVSVAAVHYESGGVANSNGMSGGSGSPPSGSGSANGTMPSASGSVMPSGSGAPPSDSAALPTASASASA